MPSKNDSAPAYAAPVKTDLPLAEAEEAAQAHSDGQSVGAAATQCPYAPKQERTVIEIEVLGEDGAGLDGISVQIVRGDGQVLTGKSAPTGKLKFTGLEAGDYKLSLPELDKDAWLVTNTQVLPEAEAKCTGGIANWQAATSPSDSGELSCIIKQGECVGKVAERYGFFPKTIWNDPANADLKKLRHDNMYVLHQDDVLVIPAKRQKTENIATASRVTVQRQGVPEYLHIRFFDDDALPCAEVPYVLSLITDTRAPLADIFGKTDVDGFVNQPVPPGTVSACVTLNPGEEEEIYSFNIGYVDPIDEISGWQARLNNLGYECGAEDDILGPKTQAAIRAFQNDRQLEETGKRDEATKAELLAMALS